MIILSLLVDTDLSLRKRGVSLILKARNQLKPGIRYYNKEFKKKFLNFGAKAYYELVGDLESIEDITEPPCTKDLDENDLHMIANGEKQLEQILGQILCHNTHCERAVGMTTKAAEKYCGYKARHGYLLSKHHSRKSFGRDLTKTELLKMKHDLEACQMDTTE